MSFTSRHRLKRFRVGTLVTAIVALLIGLRTPVHAQGVELSHATIEDINTAFDAGINVFDSGFGGFYGPAERNLAPFLKQRRASNNPTSINDKTINYSLHLRVDGMLQA